MTLSRRGKSSRNTPLRPQKRHAASSSSQGNISDSGLPPGYLVMLEDLKARIRKAQVEAAVAVSRELIELYWQIGRSIAERQMNEGWGTKVLDRLSNDLRREFPGVGGFSRTNVYRMRSFFFAYSGGGSIVPQPVGQLSDENVPQAVGQMGSANLPPVLAQLPGGHNIILLEKLRDAPERLWYARQTILQGWSRAVLVHQIETDVYRRSGKAITNFAATLPAPDADLAQQLLKDPYNFDFLTLSDDAKERDLEKGLVEHLKRFLLELGVGFAFVGQQFQIEVGGDDFSIDLLFYHLRLRRFVVIDLKVEDFKPEFVGKMNFYLSAMDAQFRHEDDQPSIGLILCKTRNRLVAEYALRDTSKPMGVATYAATLPPMFRGNLPTPAELAQELNRVEPSADELKEN